jgi:tetratricopeptide (TPR) repeat protein
MNDSDVSTFGDLLRALRLQRNINQHHLAIKLDVHRNTISKWERGICLPESKTIVLELAHQLQLDAYNTQRLLEASLTAFSPRWYIPFPRNPFFTGRDTLLDRLHELLGRERTAVLSQSYALSGLGGIGKTQVAIEYAYRYANDYTAILWVAAETRESIVASAMKHADVLHLPEQHDQNLDSIVDAVRRWLNEHREWLLIFDNVEDLGLVKPLLPAARSGAVLLTTRLQHIGGIAQAINLEYMTAEEGFQFLLRRANLLSSDASGHSLPPQEVQAAREIVMLMDGLPLALDQAGAYIEATRCSLQDYQQLFQSSQLYLLDERDAYADHPLSVSKTFTLAFEQLKQNNSLAAVLLTACAFLAPEDIPETFFSEGALHLGPSFEELATDPFQFNDAIKALQTYSLLQRNANTHTLTIHRLVQVVLKGCLPEAVQRIWVTLVLRTMSQLFPANEKTQADYWQIAEQLLPHALTCITQGEQWKIDEIPYIVLMNHVATYLSEGASYVEAESLYEQALRIGEPRLGSEHPLVAEALYGQARLYFKQDKYEEAESLYQRALLIREQTLEAEHPLIAEVLGGLAILYYRRGQYVKAEPFYERALYIQEQTLGPEHPQVASVLNDLAGLYEEQGKYGEAEPLYQRALSIREQTLGIEHPQVASVLNNLANLYGEQSKYGEAEPLYQRALRIWEQGLGPEHIRVAHPLHGLADLYRKQCKYGEAEPLYQRALRIWEQGFGPEHSLIAYPLHGLADLYREQGKYEKVEPLYQRALRIRKQTLGPEHPEVAETLHHLAHFYQMQQQTVEALSLYQQALAIRERTLGLCHTKTNATRTAYVYLSKNLGCIEEAMEDQGQHCQKR